jgi:hypothetical protein
LIATVALFVGVLCEQVKKELKNMNLPVLVIPPGKPVGLVVTKHGMVVEDAQRIFF